jgi:calcineurin-like phosphoesterase family protein
MIAKWNEVVQQKDQVYVLGDFVWKDRRYAIKFIEKLKGRILFIKGNHDRGMKGEVLEKLGFLGSYHELTIQDRDALGGKQLIVLCHYPFESWNKSHWGSFHLHAHSHGNLTNKVYNRLDVGIDVAKKLLGEYRPFSYEEIKNILKEKERIYENQENKV